MAETDSSCIADSLYQPEPAPRHGQYANHGSHDSMADCIGQQVGTKLSPDSNAQRSTTAESDNCLLQRDLNG